jgi:hypothetical protein
MAQSQTTARETKDVVEGSFEQWVIRPLQETQGAWVRGAEWWWQTTRPFLPGAANGEDAEPWVELIDKSFDCAAQILETQREMTKTMLGLLQRGEEKSKHRTRSKTATSS